MKSESLVNAALAILVACALVVTGLVVRRELFTPSAVAQSTKPVKVDDWRSYAVAGQRMGPREARLTIIEFADYQCPFCRETHKRLEQLRKDHPSDVAVIHRHYPLPTHPHARAAALASECAAEQGAFESYQGVVYASQDSIGVTSWAEYAKRAGVRDSARFETCLREETFAQRVDEDMAAGRRLGLRATPTLLVNDMKVEGAIPEELLRRYLDESGR